MARVSPAAPRTRPDPVPNPQRGGVGVKMLTTQWGRGLGAHPLRGEGTPIGVCCGQSCEQGHIIGWTSDKMAAEQCWSYHCWNSVLFNYLIWFSFLSAGIRGTPRPVPRGVWGRGRGQHAHPKPREGRGLDALTPPRPAPSDTLMIETLRPCYCCFIGNWSIHINP